MRVVGKNSIMAINANGLKKSPVQNLKQNTTSHHL